MGVQRAVNKAEGGSVLLAAPSRGCSAAIPAVAAVEIWGFVRCLIRKKRPTHI
jgi:hypothetical protein